MDSSTSYNYNDKYNDKDKQNKIPEPPAPEIDIRTMESDLRAFKEGGGELPGAGVRTVFTPTSFNEEERNEKELAQQPINEIPGYSGPEKPIFEIEESSSGQNQRNFIKFIFLIIGILVGIIGLGLLGYYVIFPMIFR